MAWQTAALVGAAFAGKLPPLQTLLTRAESGEQSFEHMKAQLTTLSKLTGFPVREVGHG